MLDLSTLGQKKPAAIASAYIKDTNSATFEQDVLAASMTGGVIVDFWAPWCGPCKQMTPMIEKAVDEAGGAVTLVKVNIDENPDLAQIFRVQSIPMVYAFFQGQPVDGFMGAKPESEIKAFVTKLAATAGAAMAPVAAVDVTLLLQQADQFLKDGNVIDAMAAYSTALDQAPDNMDAMAGLGWAFLAQDDRESALAVIEQLTPEQKENPRIKGLDFILGQSAEGLAPRAALEKRIEENPKDSAARFDLARHLLAAGSIEGAIDALIELIRRDREWSSQKARQFLLQIFDALGAGHALALSGRRKLSAILFS